MVPESAVRFTSASSVEVTEIPKISFEPEVEVIPSTYPEEEDDVLEIDDPYWEEFDDVVDPVLGTESDLLDNLGEGTSSGVSEIPKRSMCSAGD